MTDHGKISKKGLMTLELDDSGKYVTKTEGTGDPAKVGEQDKVYCCRVIECESPTM